MINEMSFLYLENMTPFSLRLSASLLVLASFFLVSNGAEEYQEVGLRTHNTLRKKHEAPDMVLSDWLDEQAKKCAEYYVTDKKTIDHSCTFKKTEKDEGTGENLWMSSWTPESTNTNFKAEAESATKDWYDEIKDYSFKDGKFGMDTGHFTQVVWKKSKELGIGAYNNSEMCVVVALYFPPGNYKGEFQANVIAEKDSSSESSSSFAMLTATASKLPIVFALFMLILIAIRV